MENSELLFNEEDELTHWGIRGMKWGIRRYQTKDGKLTPEGRKRYADDVARLKEEGQKLDNKIKSKAAAAKAKSKVDKLIAENEAKRRALKAKSKGKDVDDDDDEKDEKMTPEEYETAKQKAIKSGTAADVLKFKGDLTNQQLNDAVNRLRSEAALEEISAKSIKTARDKVDAIMDTVNQVTNWTNKGIAAYNTLAKINNTFGNSKWKIIGQESKGDKDKKDNNGNNNNGNNNNGSNNGGNNNGGNKTQPNNNTSTQGATNKSKVPNTSQPKTDTKDVLPLKDEEKKKK